MADKTAAFGAIQQKTSRTIAVNNTTGILVQAGVTALYGWCIINSAAATRFVKLYNKATAPTVGTDVPVITIGIAAGQTIFYDNSPMGNASFPLGLGLGITNLVADADTTAPAANDVICHLFYI